MKCKSPEIVVGGVVMSVSDFENAKELITIIGNDTGDPSYDEYEENIANGNNDKSTSGIQIPPPIQTTPPPPIPETPEKSIDTPPPVKPTTPADAANWTGNYNLQLSPNFKVRDFTIDAVWKHQMMDYAGFSADTRCTNLKALALNVAEPMLAKFGKFKINSGLRNSSSSKGVSQHIKGEAIDIQFPGWSYARYWENAAWVKDNIPYDQFIFEHSTASGLAWYHLSFSRTSNRAVTNPSKVLTMYKNNYSPGLKKYF